MATDRTKLIDFPNKAVSVNHELCRQCAHDKDCTHVCIAIETLVQLAKVRSPMAQLEYVYNVGTQLDLANSCTADDL